MIKKIFVTGTDTNVGKTIVSSILLKKATILGYKTAAYKPVSSGMQKKKGKFFNEDVSLLQKSSSVYLNNKEINPISFIEYAPPHILSFLQKKKIKKNYLSLILKKISQKSNWILIEGAGGWYTPLSEKYTFSDWVKQEKLIVVLVVGVKLGCINHAILTEKAIFSEHLTCSGWIANSIFPNDEYTIYYIKTLLNYMKSPLLGIVPYLQNIKKINYDTIKIQLP